MDSVNSNFTVDDFNYDLPKELIASEPSKDRDASQLLVISRTDEGMEDQIFSDINNWLRPGDLLILNDTKVFPARLLGVKESGGKVEVLAERLLPDGLVKAQVKSNRTLKQGTKILFEEDVSAIVCGREEEFFILEFFSKLSPLAIFERYGHVPLPPYIDREDCNKDKERYQTVYADKIGAVAAPTAGLHFTKELLDELKSQGVMIESITLHVGAGTFKPVKVDDPSQHKMHEEFVYVSQQVCEKIAETKKNGGRIIAVGTTCVRALESAALSGELNSFEGETDIFIYPGFKFNVIDALITNFHLPRSTLLMLVSAFAGKEKIHSAYSHAIRNRYRFFSYGDAMFITP